MAITDEQIRETTLKCYALIMDVFGNREMVERPNGEWVHYEDVLSKQPEPLLKMYVGMEWVLEQEGNPWDGMLVKCVREDTRQDKLEQLSLSETEDQLDSSYYTCGAKEFIMQDIKFIVQCIDPAFWTGEIEGERVRCYENQNGDVIIRSTTHFYHYDKEPTLLDKKIWFSAIKNAGIPIAPFGYFDKMIAPPPISETETTGGSE